MVKYEKWREIEKKVEKKMTKYENEEEGLWKN